MNPLFFILRKYLKNQIKELRKKPLVLAAYIIAAISFVFMLAVSFIMPSSLLRRGSADLFGAIITAVLLIFIYFSIKQGINTGSSFFTVADVNLVFTAPISPKKVLVYGFIQQLIVTFFIILFVSFQIPNLKNNFPITGIGILIIYIAIFILVFIMQLISMLIYSFSSKSKRIRKNLERSFNALIGLFILGLLLVILQEKDFAKASIIYLNSPVFEYIPFISWIKVIMMSAVEGISPVFYLDVILVLLTAVILILVIYKQKTDYYENVLAATELKDQLKKAKKEGKANAKLLAGKVRKVQFKFNRTGAGAVFQRHMLEYRKSGLFLLNKFSLIIIAIGLASKYFFPYSSMKTVLYFTIYMLFFFTIQGKWVQELNKPFIYLIPASSASKVFFATVSENLKNGMDGLLLFAAAGYMFKSDFATIILSALSYISFGAVYVYGDVLSRKLFGETHSKNLEVFIKMFLILFVLTPGIVISIIIGLTFKNSALGEYGSYIVLIGYNAAASSIILFMTKGIFEKMEMR